MPKALCITGMVIAVLLLLIFLADLLIGFPFSRASVVADIGYVLAAAGLGYLSWSTYKDL